MVFPRAEGMKELAAMFREAGAGGQGRIAYFAGDVDRTCWRSSNTDLSRLLQNAIAWTRGTAPPLLRVEGAGVIEMFLWRTAPGYALHVVNYTNPHMMRGWAREHYPIGPLRIDLAPLATPIKSARALRAGRDLTIATRDGRLRFEIPTVVDYEVIALT
jgi:hypothetical protein